MNSQLFDGKKIIGGNKMVNSANKTSFGEQMKRIFAVIKKALKNDTFLYILKRILSCLFTILLIIAVVTALVRLLPETSLYDISLYFSFYRSFAFAQDDRVTLRMTPKSCKYKEYI